MIVFPEATWFVGCGNMAGAMVEGWRAAGTDLAGVTAIRPSGVPVDGVRTVSALPDGPAPALVMLGFKPQKLDDIASDLERRTGKDTIIISLLAGVEVASLRRRFPGVRAIVRAMPNLPVAQRKGVVALFGDDNEDALEFVRLLMGPLGFVPVVGDEAQFSAVGAVAGSGPAYVARFVDALAIGGSSLGLSPDLARQIALETVVGTAAMAVSTEVSMAELARRVASPKGTTEAGLAVLDAADGIERLVARMLAASIERGRQLADAARSD